MAQRRWRTLTEFSSDFQWCFRPKGRKWTNSQRRGRQQFSKRTLKKKETKKEHITSKVGWNPPYEQKQTSTCKCQFLNVAKSLWRTSDDRKPVHFVTILHWHTQTYNCNKHSQFLALLSMTAHSHNIYLTTDMRRLTTGIRSEKCVVRRFRCCANVYLHRPR